MSICLKISAFLMTLVMSFISIFTTDYNYKYKVTSPDINGNYTEEEKAELHNADFYISTSGSDDNDGSFASPFATFERAMKAVADTDKSDKSEITVAAMAGDYRVNTLDFSAVNGGTDICKVTYAAYGDGEVTINGGITLDTAKFSNVKDEKILSRLGDDAKKSVLCYDLKQDGITAEDYGKIYAIGSYNTASKYTGDTEGPLYCELFVNDERMTIARYPNDGYLYTEKVISTGEGKESGDDHVENPGWDTAVDPESDVYEVSQSLADRINSWATLDDVWMFGFWKYDWADASSPVGSFDYGSRQISPKYVSLYGTKEDAPYYFFNVLEELDNPGEWYLDRNSGILYLYPGDGFETADVDLSLSTDNIISGEGLGNVSFEGFTIKGTRGDAVNISGDNVTFKNCLVKNVAGNAIILSGYNNLVTDCEITHTGKGGIYIDGGDRETLTAGNSKADNNLIHDWSEIYQTYQPAVTLKGVGNICSHNEIYNSPHEAISYFGNNQLIEYNLIYNVCLLSDDAGAIYAGRRWDFYGTVIRYNCIHDIGSGSYTPDGIYFDDALSGQTAYGNLLVNIPGYGFHLGGGRDLIVKNNILVNTGDRAVSYDQRAIDGVNGGWFTHSASLDSDMWQNLLTSPWQSEVWQEAYPQMKSFSTDFGNQDDPGFVPNPAGSDVSGNLMINLKGSIGMISDSAKKFSNISDNAIFNMFYMNSIFTDYSSGDYTLKANSPLFKKLPDFEALPISEIGRY